MEKKTYVDEKGAVYTEDRKILLQIPKGAVEFTVPEGTEEIGEDVGDVELHKVTLPSSLRKIWPHAFYGCLNLESVSIPDSVEEIGFGAFALCENLKTITLPNNLKEIEASLFDRDSSLKQIILPDSIEHIGEDAFRACHGLEQVVLPKKLQSIGDNAFSYSKLKTIALPEGLQSIGHNAFYECKHLDEITLPKSLKTINGNPFNGCSATITSLSPKFKAADGALYGNHGKRLIHATTSGKSYHVADGVEIIGAEALDMQVDELVISSSVRTIEPTFGCCSAKHIIFEGEVQKMPKKPIYEVLSNVERITIPKGTSSHYAKLFRFIIEES